MVFGNGDEVESQQGKKCEVKTVPHFTVKCYQLRIGSLCVLSGTSRVWKVFDENTLLENKLG